MFRFLELCFHQPSRPLVQPFKKADTDHSQSVTLEEALAAAPEEVPQEVVEQHHAMMDADQDGHVTIKGLLYIRTYNIGMQHEFFNLSLSELFKGLQMVIKKTGEMMRKLIIHFRVCLILPY